MTNPPPFRAEHIGSLLRPRALKTAHKAFRAGEIDNAQYQEALDAALDDAVRLQERAGLRIISDGEFRRASWFSGFFDALDGFTLTDSKFDFRDDDGHRHGYRTCYVNGRIKRHDGIALNEYASIASRTAETPKVTMPTPSAFHFLSGGDCVDPAVYPDLDKFWDDLIAIYQTEIDALAQAGARYFQFDEVPLAMLCDDAVRQQSADLGLDPVAIAQDYRTLLNRVLAARPSNTTFAVHLCRGNFRSRWMASGGYEPVAERLFGEVVADGFLLEYDTERAGDFEPLRFVPDDKWVVLGLISTKTAELESVDDLRRRVDEAARYVPLERLAISPQCGFASVAGGNLIDEDDQRRKLELVVKVADLVWGSA